MKSLYLFSLILSSHFIRSESVEILLCGNLSPSLILIIPAFHKHIIHHANGHQTQIPDGNPQLHTPEKKQRSCHFTVCCMKFFFSLHIRLNVHPPQLNQLRQDLINTVVLHHAANTPSHSALSYLFPTKYTLLLPFKNEKQPENVLLMAKS